MADSGTSEKGGSRGSGRGSSKGTGKRPKGSKSRLRKWEIERRRRRMQKMVPWAVLAVALVVVVAGASLLLPKTPTPSGGNGPCDYPHVPLQHYHVSLTIFQDGALRNIPGDIGIDPALTADTSLRACTSGDPAHGTSPVHTHVGEANVLHVETIVDRSYTLGDFFRTWGQPIGPNAVWNLQADANHRLTMSVNGQPSNAWGDLVLVDGMQIRIDYLTV